MNRFICFDNLRSAAVVLTLAALLLQSWTAFYEESAVVAISIVFFISAYFGASALRIRTISFFLKDKWKRLGWPGLVLVLFGIEEQLVTSALPVTSWVLLWLFLLFAGLSLIKHVNHKVLQHRIASKPSVPFLLGFLVLLAAALFLCQARAGHARPGGAHRGHVLLADGPLLFPLRAAQRLALLLRLLAAAVLHIAQHGRPLIVLLRACCRAVALRLGRLGLHRPQLR